jgi:hypothetical protein
VEAANECAPDFSVESCPAAAASVSWPGGRRLASIIGHRDAESVGAPPLARHSLASLVGELI